MANPIRSVDGRVCKCPSTYEWTQEDLSNSEAGRTEDGLMHKNFIRSVEKISLAWVYLTTAEVKELLEIFSPEYITVEHLNPRSGGYITKRFYVGNRTAPLYNAELDKWTNVSFSIIEQ
ncbi:MAG: DUF6711 family protein [Candidatus Fimenecus sp.]